jgi:hypothetical protein
MVHIIQQAFFITIAFVAIGLYLWVFLSVSAWLWRKLVTSVDDHIYRPRTTVLNPLVMSMWKGAKEAPVIFFAPAILLSRGLKTATLRYINAVDQLVAQRK